MRANRAKSVAMVSITGMVLLAGVSTAQQQDLTHLALASGTYFYSIQNTTTVPTGKDSFTNIVVSCGYTVQVSRVSKPGVYARVDIGGLRVEHLPKPGLGQPADTFVSELAATQGSGFLIYTNEHSLFSYDSDQIKQPGGPASETKRHIAGMLRTPISRITQEGVAWTNMPGRLGVTLPEKLQVIRQGERACEIRGMSSRRGMASRETRIRLGPASLQLHMIEWRTVMGSAKTPPYTLSVERISAAR